MTFFGPLKNGFNKAMDKWITNHPAKRVTDYECMISLVLRSSELSLLRMPSKDLHVLKSINLTPISLIQMILHHHLFMTQQPLPPSTENEPEVSAITSISSMAIPSTSNVSITVTRAQPSDSDHSRSTSFEVQSRSKKTSKSASSE